MQHNHFGHTKHLTKTAFLFSLLIYHSILELVNQSPWALRRVDGSLVRSRGNHLMPNRNQGRSGVIHRLGTWIWWVWDCIHKLLALSMRPGIPIVSQYKKVQCHATSRVFWWTCKVSNPNHVHGVIANLTRLYLRHTKFQILLKRTKFGLSVRKLEQLT